MKSTALMAIAILPALHAAEQVSESYTARAVSLHPAATGSSGTYRNEAFIAGSGGFATSATRPADLILHGPVASLAIPETLTLTPGTPLPETQTRQAHASAILDDGTSSPLPANSPTWDIASGPASISDAGLVTAGIVYQGTPLLLQATWDGATGQLPLTILDTLPDNFGSYAADGLRDAWQVDHFGLGNPDASPTADPDADDRDNFFEFLSGHSPTDGADRFTFTIQGKSPTHAALRFNRVLPTTRYRVEQSATLGPWSPAATVEPATESDDFPVEIPSTVPANFFRVTLEPR
jgi:hypothetical protein